MGNALQFVNKFNNIKLNQENQNYAGAWLEYGSILHIILDFQPLALATRDTIYDRIAQFLVDNHILDNEIEAHKAAEELSKRIDEEFESITGKINSLFSSEKEKLSLKAAKFSGSETLPLLQGIGKGMADVFPQGSIQDLCRLNVSAAYTTSNTMFFDWGYSLPNDYPVFFGDVANLMTYPYGITFNCFYSA